MCWSAEISLSTFVFGIAGMVIAYINNLADLKWVAFYFTITSMQLLEYFIWKTIGNNDASTNELLSKIGLFIILMQPITIGFIIKNNSYKAIYFVLLAIFLLTYLYTASPIKFSTSIAKNGHLNWEWLQLESVGIIIIWCLFMATALWLSSTSFVDALPSIIFTVSLVMWSYYTYRSYGGAWGSVYCSFINLAFTYMIALSFYKNYCGYSPKQ